jgi:DNA repair protein RadA/Sms
MAKSVFFCSECGNETPRWQGQCPACGRWNTIVEEAAPKKSKSAAVRGIPQKKPVRLRELEIRDETRFMTGLGEFDRVLGGGAVTGSLVLVGGSPGIGKSTLLLQICGLLDSGRILYVSGEESERQLKMRAERLKVDFDDLFILSETGMEGIEAAVEEIKPKVLIVDSIQTVYNAELTSAPGSVGQVKDCAMTLMKLAKAGEITVFLIGHVNKEGAIAGPKVLEHMVDCVLYFEGEKSHSYRILRAAKNRFGSTNEIGVFEMREDGLHEVQNPSEALLSGRPENTPGTCVTCVLEGSRPILAEVQALVAPSGFTVPRRNSNGIEYNRAMMLLAVLEKRGGFKVAGCDSYINVVGGMDLADPGADLAVIAALASGYRDTPVPYDLAAFGEVGLTGEIRAVSRVDARLSEIKRLGFKKCLMPFQGRDMTVPEGLEIIKAKTILDALRFVLGKG